MFLMFSWTSYQRCGQTMWSGRSFSLWSSHGRDTGWFPTVSWWGVTLMGFKDCCIPATLTIFSGGSESIVRSGQLLKFIIRSLVRPQTFTQEITSHFNAQTAFSAVVCYLGPVVWMWLWAAWAWISSHRTECLRRLCAGRNLRTKGEKPYKTT